MVLPDSRFLAPYRDRNVVVTLGVVGMLLFVTGLTAMYEAHLRGVYEHQLALSPVEWVAYGTGAFLVDPVALFVVLFVVSRRLDDSLDVLSILPGVVVVVLVGSVLGQFVGSLLFSAGVTNLSLGLLVGRAIRLTLSFEPIAIRIWRFALELVVWDVLTVVAALSFGTLTRE